MSTAGRINKSQTKFVPKRKNTSGSTQRAASATPSVAGTPRVTATGGLALPPTTEEDFSLDGAAGGEAGGSGVNKETFLVPPAPASKGPKSPALAPKAIPTPIAAGSSFGPSDPTASSQASSSQSQSQAPSSLGLSFGPRDPSSSAPTTQYTSTQDEPRPTPPASSSPRRSPGKSKGTTFGVSLHGPQSSPPRASTSSTPAPAPSPHAPLANLAAAATAAASADRDGGASPPHRTQRELEEAAEVERKAEKARKKQEKADAAAKKKEEKRLAKEAKAAKKKGKGKAVEGEEGQAEEEDVEEEEPVAAPKPKRKPKPKGKRKTVDDDEEEEEQPVDELATPRDANDEGEDEEFVPSPPKKKVKRKAAAAKPKAKSKKKKAITGEDDSESDGEVDAVTKRRRKKLGVGRKKQTKADIEIFGRRKENGAGGSDVDMEAASGEEHGSDSDDSSANKRPHRKSIIALEVDPATTTMAEIATGRDMVAGRTSERGRELAKKAMEARLNRRLRAQKMKRHAARRKEGLPSDSEPEEVDEEEEATALKKASEEGTPVPPQARDSATPVPLFRDSSPVVDEMAAVFGRSGTEEPVADEEDEDDDGKKADGADEDDEEQGDGEAGEKDEYGDLVESQYAPQMRIVDGQLVIDESSLVVDRALDANMGHVGPREVVHEAAQDRMVNSASWGKRQATEKWTSDETDKFFDGVSQFGTDFEMIAGLFPNRTRRQIKSKWNKEDKINPAAITRALMTRKAINLEHYASVTGQDLSGPVPDDPLEAINKRRAEEEANERAAGGPDRYLPTNHAAKSKKAKKEEARARAEKVMEEVPEEDDEDGETALEKLEREEREQEALDAEIAAELEAAE